MARRLDNHERQLYRAVIQTVYLPDPGSEEYGEQVYYRFLGPYTTRGQALAAITRAKKPRYWDPPGTYTATGYVESTLVDWGRDGPSD